jgi:oligopeptide transport system substrate-binding protein
VVEGKNTAVANALCNLWNEVLQLQVEPIGVSEEEFWTIIRSGEYDLAGTHLDALINDAECFLRTWTSSNPDNLIAYENSAYDTLLQIIATAEDGVARMGCLHDAEILLLEDYVIAPLYSLGTDWLLREPYVGAYRDARGWFLFADTFIPTA